MLATCSRSISFSICLIAGLAVVATGQVTPVFNHQTKFSTTDGLPNGYVLAIQQDNDGFIWVGTADGLARYDGKNFRKFPANQHDSSGLRFNNIHGLLMINERLWLFYFNGQRGRMDPRTFETTHFITPLKDETKFTIALEALKNLGPDWVTDVSGDGKSDHLLTIDTSRLKLVYAHEKVSAVNGPVRSFTKDNIGNLWMLTNDGLEVSLDERWEEFRKLTFPITVKPLVDEDVRAVYSLPNSRIAVIIRDKILIYDPGTRTFKLLSIPVVNQIAKTVYVRVCRDNSGRLILSANGYVFLLTDQDDLKLLWKLPEADVAVITTLFVDRTNTLWVGTPGFGLYSVNMFAPSIKSQAYEVNFLTDLLTKELGVPMGSIPDIWKTRQERQHWLRSFYDRDSNIYISSHREVKKKGPFIFRLEGSKFIPLPSSVERSIVGLRENPAGIWALNQEGELFQWSDITSQPVLTQIPNLFADEQNSPGLFDLEVDEEFLWASSKFNGLYQLSGTELVDHFPPGTNHDGGIPNFEISDIINDPVDPHWLWIGTLGGGLVKWDKTKEFAAATYTIRDGLPNNSIGAIVPDNDGRLWISTSQGVSVFSKAEEQFTNYTKSDGAFEDEFQRFISFKLPDGRIAFGGVNGYSIFDPEKFQRDASEPVVHLTQFYLASEPVDHRTNKGLLSQGLNSITRIDLDHDQNTIDFDVAVMQFNNPGKNRFRYKLLNYEDDWVNVGADQHIRFSKLPYGSYKLIVGATNTSGIWSPHTRELSIRILPPWYRTWYAYVIYSISVVGMLWFLWMNARRNLHRRQQIEFDKREALRLRELDETKTRFFSNVTHEFRTPLTLILSPLEKFLKDGRDLSPGVRKLLDRNYLHARQLLRLVNQLLDISKLESGKMTQNDTVGDLGAFVEQTVQPFRDQAEERNIRFSFRNKNVEGQCLFDNSKWEKIISNLLGNAMKFTSKGSIDVDLELVRRGEEQAFARMIVSDTGIGIERNLVPRIFERFYQVDDSATRKHEGTGIGLSLVKELVDLMGGTIKVESEPGRGAVFTVELPYERIKDQATLGNLEINPEPDENHTDETQPLLLVVEDNDELRAFLVESLSGQWTCMQAPDGNRAWEIIEKELPDLVVSDVMMPGMNGYELCAKTKNDPGTKHISFVLLTARAAQEAVVEGLESGADEYVSKPFHMHELELRIRNLLHQQYNIRRHLQDTLFPQEPLEVHPTVKDVFLQNLYDFVNANINEPGMDPDRIASEMAMSKSTLNRKLKTLMNLSITEFVRQLRLQKSLELIHAGYNISEIAYQVGFESHSYFSRCFKERFAKTPSEYAESR